MRSFSVSGSSFSVETSEGRPGTKYMFVRDMSPYADNVYSSNDKSAHGRSTAGVAVRVGGSTMAVDCDKRGSKTYGLPCHQLKLIQEAPLHLPWKTGP